ncbi:hypothetical protein [Acinetobacter guillouiae]|uniref:hypothetical protein n=1 Tax=Acinetobacter guillouiae TaxID=106649 RepID=UPI003AF71804
MHIFFRLLTIVFFLISTNVEAKQKLYTGEEIAKTYKLLQSITIPAIYENRVVLTKYANFYKTDGGECIIVSRLDNESNFGGYEDVIYFKKRIMLRSSKQSFFSIFLDDDAKIKSKKIKYSDYLNGKEVQQGLKEDFILYRKKMNKNTLNQC